MKKTIVTETRPIERVEIDTPNGRMVKFGGDCTTYAVVGDGWKHTISEDGRDIHIDPRAMVGGQSVEVTVCNGGWMGGNVWGAEDLDITVIDVGRYDYRLKEDGTEEWIIEDPITPPAKAWKPDR